VADLKGDVVERNPVTEALAQAKRGQRRAPRFASDAATFRGVTKRSPRAWTAGSSRPDTATSGSAGDVVRRLSFPMSHLIR
jgi:hypothetical protein